MAKFHHSPKGVALYPFIVKPQTRFNPDGVYKMDLVLDGDSEECQAFMEQLTELRDDALEDKLKGLKPAKRKKVTIMDPWDEELDEETGEETGRIIFKFRQVAQVYSTRKDKTYHFSVALFDAKGKRIKPEDAPMVGNGSIVRASFDINPWYVKDEAGISLKLKAVQLIDVVEYDGNSAEDYGFGEEEVGDDDAAGYFADDPGPGDEDYVPF